MSSVFHINPFTPATEAAEATSARPRAWFANGVDLETAVALARRCER
jgi:hypothetical protein